jgi:AP2-like factor (ANT lineage)
MASSTLLAGELAKRNKETGSTIKPIDNGNGEVILPKKKDECESDWKMALYQSSQEPHTKSDKYRTQYFPVGSDNMIQQLEVEDSVKMGTHLSNASSLVTSLSSSREGSPDKTSLPAVDLYGLPPSASKLFTTSPTAAVNSWIPSPQLRPALSMPHIPLFAAWTDA